MSDEPPGAPRAIVTVEQAAKHYRLGHSTVEALRGVDLTVGEGEFLAIAGPSGSGKTTLLNLIGCLESPTSGRIVIDGVDTGRQTSDALAALRARKIGFVFQQFNLFPVLTALENVEYPLLLTKLPSDERRYLARRALEQVGLSAVTRHKPSQLSGGQQQRVAIARAMVGEPLLILADEPTANLDHKTGTEILQLMRSINQQRHATFIFSTHDPHVMGMATRLVRLWDGCIGQPP